MSSTTGPVSAPAAAPAAAAAAAAQSSAAGGGARKEIYTYASPFSCVYGLAASHRAGAAHAFRYAVGSFVEEYCNKIEIVQVDEGAAGGAGDIVQRSVFDHAYPATRIQASVPRCHAALPRRAATPRCHRGGAPAPASARARMRAATSARPPRRAAPRRSQWAPEPASREKDLLATAGDYLRLYQVMPDGDVRLDCLLNNVRARAAAAACACACACAGGLAGPYAARPHSLLPYPFPAPCRPAEPQHGVLCAADGL